VRELPKGLLWSLAVVQQRAVLTARTTDKRVHQ